MEKENWLKYVMRQKDKLERVLNVDNDKNFEIATHTYVSFLNESFSQTSGISSVSYLP